MSDYWEEEYLGIRPYQGEIEALVTAIRESIEKEVQEEISQLREENTKLQGFTWAIENHLNPIEIPFPNILNFYESKDATYSYTEKTLYEASEIVEDEEKNQGCSKTCQSIC